MEFVTLREALLSAASVTAGRTVLEGPRVAGFGPAGRRSRRRRKSRNHEGAHVPGTNLTRDEAAQRAQLLDVTGYEVTLDLTTGDKVFGSTTVVRFRANEPGSSTFVDLIAGDVHRVVLNGRDLAPHEVVSTGRIALADLQAENELRVVADGTYMHTGEGLHRFVDPVDGETYVYSQFEVADARRVFACFDQPDLKAPLTLTVTAPAHWTVVGVSPSPEPENAGEGVSTWRFMPTPKLSPYVQAVVAGPYHAERGSVRSRDGREIPLGVYCRRSLAQYLDADEVMDVARQGFGYFEELFDLPYPFAKY